MTNLLCFIMPKQTKFDRGIIILYLRVIGHLAELQFLPDFHKTVQKCSTRLILV